MLAQGEELHHEPMFALYDRICDKRPPRRIVINKIRGYWKLSFLGSDKEALLTG
jgi:hypothetical protein